MLKFWNPDLGTQVANAQAPLGGGPPTLASVYSLTQTTDPGPNNDITQGIGIGAWWLNTVTLRSWVCRSNAQGAAAWVFEGADYTNGGTNPPNEVTSFGSSLAPMAEEGNINRQVVAPPGLNPNGTGSDYVLAVYTLPANAFDISGRGITITAQGSFGATTNNKRIKIIFNPASAVVGSAVGGGGTTIADTGVVTTNGSGWSVQANVFKTGSVGSNTQVGLHQQSQVGGAVSALVAPQAIAAVENATILIAVTGNATSAANDIAFNFLEVNACN